MVQQLNQLLEQRNLPNIIVLHMGTNDLGQITSAQFKHSFTSMVHQISDVVHEHLQVPGSPHNFGKIVISSILPCRAYFFATKIKGDKIRRHANKIMVAICKPPVTYFLDNDTVLFKSTDYHLHDSVHLNNVGNLKFIRQLYAAAILTVS